MGAKVEITSEMLDQIEQFASEGLTEEQIAHSMGIGYSTFQRKKLEDGEIGERIKVGKSKGVQKIVNKVFQRAQGYSIEEEKVFCHDGDIIRATVVKHYPPDLGSAIFYLTNRDPENWKNTKHVQQTNINPPIDPAIKAGMTPQEAAQSYADTLRQGNGGNVVPIKGRK